jgi:hypothetical protein
MSNIAKFKKVRSSRIANMANVVKNFIFLRYSPVKSKG